jgi:hypothetical protein
MTDHRLLGRAVVSIGFAAVALIPGIASAASGAGQSTFTLTVTESQDSRTVTLNCDPTSGNHPHADLACDELLAVDAQFQRLDPGRQQICTKESRKVEASAEGTWRGRPIGYQVSVANPCALKAATGSVFDF